MASLSITETVSWGILYYGFPVMLRPMEADLGYSRVQLTGARAVAPFAAALLQVALGGYEPVFWLLAGALVLAAVGLLAAPSRIHDG